MATVVTAAVPAREFALHATFEAVPEVEFECERIVETGNRTVMPLVWARGASAEAVDEALEADPSVEFFDRLATFDEEFLYRMEWVDRVELVVQIITAASASVLDATGDGNRWVLRVLFPDRDALSGTDEFCKARKLTFDVRSVRQMEGEPSGRYGLTADQHEALRVAYRMGYFEVPRQVDLGDVADELGITHQSLSERLRRAHGGLIRDTILIGEIDDQVASAT